MDEQKLDDIRSSWILPSGKIKIVTHENHDNELPKPYKTVKDAEKICVRISCAWGYDAPISKIYIPKRPTKEQVKVLYDMNEITDIKKNLSFLFSDFYNLNELIDLLY